MSNFIFGVDLDGVCADYKGGMRHFVAAKRGVPVETLTEEVSWEFSEWGLTMDEYAELHAEAVMRRRLFATLPVIDGAAEALWRLSDAGVWIRVITHRLFLNGGHATAVTDTCTWLDAHNIPYRDLCFLGDKPHIEAAVYVDDAVHNIEALRAGDNDVIVFDQPYNRSCPGPRAHTWADVEAYVLDRYRTHTGA